MVKLELTEQEVQALLVLIDIAVKANGMNVAEAGVILSNKLRAAAQPAQAEEAQKAVRAKKEKKGEEKKAE